MTSPLTITNVADRRRAGGPNDSADFQIVSQTCSGAGGSAAGIRAVASRPRAARASSTWASGRRKTNYTSVARLQFTSSADTATENVLLVGKSTGDAIVNVGGNVPSVLQLAIPNTGGSFGTFVPGIGTNYNTAVPATVTTTTGDAALSVTDRRRRPPATSSTGRSRWPRRSRRARSASATRRPGLRAAERDARRAAPAQELERPITAAPLTIDLRQAIGATESLRAGTYSKALTFTLSTTTP